MTSRTWGPDGSGIPISSANLNGIESDITAATNTANAAIPATQKGTASGVATLDASSLVPVAQLPAATTGAKGAVQLAGNLAGTAAAPSVVGVQGVAVSATAPTAGQVLTASSGTAAAWATPSGGGGYPQPGPVSGFYLDPGYPIRIAALTADTNVIPYPVGVAVTAKGLDCYVGTAVASSTATLALYGSTAGGLPGALLGSVSADTSTTGQKSVLFTTPISLTPGLYWVGAFGVNGGSGFSSIALVASGRQPGLALYVSGDVNRGSFGYQGYTVSGAPPANWPTTLTPTSNAPVVRVWAQ